MLQTLLNRFTLYSYKYHLVFAFFIRIIIIFYTSEWYDIDSELPYTDIDYKVFTDASRHILNSKSPYERHTYRYTPLIALLLIPNILLHNTYGKIIFSLVDLLVGFLIRIIVLDIRRKIQTNPTNKSNERQIRKKLNKLSQERNDLIPNYCMLFWIYNPLTIVISTRGNCDSIAAFLVILTLYLLLCEKEQPLTLFLAGIIHGLVIHIRLYPIMYSLSYYMYLSKFRTNSVSDQQILPKLPNESKTIFKKRYLSYLIPNSKQLSLISGCLVALVSLTGWFYYLYGYKFLYETYLYHLIRKDTRHNFSLFFYIQYLTAGVKNIGIWQKILSILPQLVLFVVLSVRYGLNKFTLPFSILTQTIVIVSYNSVLTSQYFVWIVAILPLCLWQFQITKRTCIIFSIIWFGAQIAWLLPAYLLEFHHQNTFMFIWLQSVSFFCANMAILGRLIQSYMNNIVIKNK